MSWFALDLRQCATNIIHTNVTSMKWHTCPRSNNERIAPMLADLLATAHRYQVKGLLHVCTQRMADTLNADNCVARLTLADTLEIGLPTQLRTRALQVILEHYTEVCATWQFKQLSQNATQDEQASRIFAQINEAVAQKLNRCPYFWTQPCSPTAA